MVRSNTAYDDVGAEVVLPTDRGTDHAPQHGNLPNVRQGVGDWPLEELLGRSGERLARGHVGVEGFEAREKAPNALIPRDRHGVVPFLGAPGNCERPLEQVAEMRQDLAGSASGSQA